MGQYKHINGIMVCSEHQDSYNHDYKLIIVYYTSNTQGTIGIAIVYTIAHYFKGIAELSLFILDRVVLQLSPLQARLPLE